jgi:hypothetical protein
VLAPVLFATAADGDAVATGLVDAFADEVAVMATALIRRLRLTRSDVEVVLGGGTLQTGNGVLHDRVAAGIAAVAARGHGHRPGRAAGLRRGGRGDDRRRRAARPRVRRVRAPARPDPARACTPRVHAVSARVSRACARASASSESRNQCPRTHRIRAWSTGPVRALQHEPVEHLGRLRHSRGRW